MVRRFLVSMVLFLSAAAAAWTIVGCSKPDVGGEIIASVDGDDIKAQELREFLGVRGAGAQASEVPVEKKREALDRLIAGRLLAREARAKGLDNTEEFRHAAKVNEETVLISALFQKEAASKVKVSKGDIKEQAKKLIAADKTLSEDNATLRAGRLAAESQIRKIEEDLIAAARKETPATVNEAEVGKLAKGEKLADETVLATVGGGKITYGEVKALLRRVPGGTHGGQDLSTNAVAVTRMLDRETIGRALVAHAKKQGIEGSEWEKSARANMQRSVLIDMIAEKEFGKGTAVSDKEVAEAYAQHGQMFVRDGKKIPLAEIREQIRAFLQNEKRKKALDSYIGDLKKKAKITVKEGLLSKV